MTRAVRPDFSRQAEARLRPRPNRDSGETGHRLWWAPIANVIDAVFELLPGQRRAVVRGSNRAWWRGSRVWRGTGELLRLVEVGAGFVRFAKPAQHKADVLVRPR